MSAASAAMPDIGMRLAVMLFIFSAGFAAWRLVPAMLVAAGTAFARVAGRRTASILLVMGLAAAGRLALLPILPAPNPALPDEFAHLLSADTLVSGRIANPTPRHWRELENMFCLYEPAYQGKYPIGQAAFLAVGQIAGHPWFGVLLATTLFAGALCWMLQGWLPASWALLGALVGVARVAFVSPWANSYFGGSVAGLGGCLALGAFIRLWRNPGIRWGVWLGLGIAALMHTRPYESACFAAVLGIALLWRVWRLRQPRSYALPLLAACAVGAVSAGLVIYQNWRITGSPFKLPYQRAQEVIGVPPGLYFQNPPVLARPVPERIRVMYEWQMGFHRQGQDWPGYLRQFWEKIRVFFDTHAGYFILPIAIVVAAGRFRRVRFLALLVAACLLWSSPYPFFYEYYLAHLLGAILALSMLGLLLLVRWRVATVPVGGFLTAVILFSSVQSTPYRILLAWKHKYPYYEEVVFTGKPLRAEIEKQLGAIGGRHIVFVRSTPGAKVAHGWYYNGANIEQSRIIWAQEVDAEADRQFLDYYTGRHVWSLRADSRPPELEPYRRSDPVSAE